MAGEVGNSGGGELAISSAGSARRPASGDRPRIRSHAERRDDRQLIATKLSGQSCLLYTPPVCSHGEVSIINPTSPRNSSGIAGCTERRLESVEIRLRINGRFGGVSNSPQERPGRVATSLADHRGFVYARRKVKSNLNAAGSVEN